MSIKTLLLTLTASIAILSSVTCAKTIPSSHELDDVSLRELLSGIDPDALHDILHQAENTRYRHGVFEEDQNAMAAILKENPAEATKIVNLAKRQANTTAIVPPTSVSISSSTTMFTSNGAVLTSDTTSSSTLTSSSSSAPDSSTSSSQQAASTSTSSSASSTSSISSSFTSTLPIASVTSSSTSSTTRTTSASSSSSPTTTTSGSMTTSITSSASTLVGYTTLPNGQQSAITSVVVVGGPTTYRAPTGLAGNPTDTANPSVALQSAGAQPTALPQMLSFGGVLGGLVAGAFLV